MTDSRSDLWLKRVWLVNGVVRHVLPRGLRLDKYSVRDPKTMVVTALDMSKQTSGDDDAERRAPERAFLYDVATGRLQAFAALDSLVARAGRVIAVPASR